jgi:hypothetical protein
MARSKEEQAVRRKAFRELREEDRRAEELAALRIVRLWDMFDGWIDITGPVSEEEAKRVWNEKTANGTRKTEYSDGDYYKIFPADTRMIYTPEFMGR